jgi:hypothetical protein
MEFCSWLIALLCSDLVQASLYSKIIVMRMMIVVMIIHQIVSILRTSWLWLKAVLVLPLGGSASSSLSVVIFVKPLIFKLS